MHTASVILMFCGGTVAGVGLLVVYARAWGVISKLPIWAFWVVAAGAAVAYLGLRLDPNSLP